MTWGSQNNPDLFVKIWFDVCGRVDVNFFHVSVPDIEVYSDLPDDGTYDQKGTTKSFLLSVEMTKRGVFVQARDRKAKLSCFVSGKPLAVA